MTCVPSSLLTALALALLLPAWASAAARPSARQVPSCGLYAGPTGAGTTCTREAPCTVQEGIARLGPGKVLCLLPGTYTGSASMVSTPATLQGSADLPAWIRAETEGTVVLDGQDSRRPVHLDGQYLRVWGLDTTRGDNHNVRLMGKYLQVLRVVAYDTGAGGDGNINVGGSYNLVEDCVALGPARKHLPVGAASPGPGNVVRRCVAVWSSNLHTSSNPTNSAEVGYGQDGVLAEQNVLSWNTAPGGRVTEPEGILQLFATRNSRVFGNLLLIRRDATFNPSRIVGAWNDAGSHAQAGDYHSTQNLDFRWNVAVVEPQHPKFSQIQAYSFAESSAGGPVGTNNQIRDSVGVSGQPTQVSAGSWLPPQNMQWGTSLSAAIGEGKSIWIDSVASPGICKKMVNGQSTDEGLWPLPMTERIKAAMTRWGLPVVDLTHAVEHILGPIPDVCRGDRQPIPPEPEPEPEPPGTTSLSCTGTITQVPGEVRMECLPQTRKR